MLINRLKSGKIVTMQRRQMFMKKTLAIILVVIITLLGTFLLGLYDYNVYYNPDGTNGGTYSAAYKTYVSNKLDKNIIDNEDANKQTEAKIQYNLLFNGEYYSNEPIFKKDVVLGGKKLFTVVVYKNAVTYVKESSIVYRYETYIYGVDYEALKDLFMKQPIPQDKTIIDKAGYPTLVINFYPNEECNEDEAFYKDVFEVNGGDEIKGHKLDSSPSFTLCDYGSNPTKDENEEPIKVQYLDTRGYDYISENIDLFKDNAYVKVNAICETEETTYSYQDVLLEDKLDGFNFNGEVNTDDYNLGYNTSAEASVVLNNVDIDGVMNYNTWLFAKYVWWQCLICIVLLGSFAGIFALVLVTDIDNKKKGKKANKKKSK